MPFDGTGFTTKSITQPIPAWIARLRSYLAPSPPPPQTMPQQILRTARDMIEQKQYWTQHFYHTPDGRHCAVGALRIAVIRLAANRSDAKAAHMALLVIAKKRNYPSVEDMNDAIPHRAVLAAFDTAILNLEP